MRSVLLIIALIGLSAVGAQAFCWTVEQDGSGHFTTIQPAIEAATTGDSILVGDGVWTGPENKNLDFGGADVVTLLSRSGPSSCVIDCENDGRGFHFHSGEGRAVEVKGLTIANGYVVDGNGGGVYCHNAGPSLTNLVIQDCTAFAASHSGMGGGVAMYYSDALIRDFTITGCQAENGGGVYVYDGSPEILDGAITGCQANEAGGGAWLRGGLLARCTISLCETFDDGGGVFVAHANASVTGNRITENTAGRGGGVFFDADAVASDNVIADNDASQGAGVFSDHCYPDLINCLLDGNDAAEGGAFFVHDGGVDIEWCTVVNNHADNTIGLGGSILAADLGGGGTFFHCILYYNYGVMPDITGGGMSFCCYEFDWPGTNFPGPPEFVTGPLGAYYLDAAGSPCVDAGNRTAAAVTFEAPEGTLSMERLTTRVDEVGDTGMVDVGYHYRHGLPLDVPSDHATIQAAIEAALHGDRIRVSPGTYHERLDFGGKALKLESAAGAGMTAIDGDGGGSVLVFDDGETNATVIKGFTITDGSAMRGGGAYCHWAAPMFSGCVFTGNTGVYGGAVYCEAFSPWPRDDLVLQNCTIEGNFGGVGGGGGIHLDGSDARITDCLVADNTYGGIYAYDYADPKIDGCTIAENDAVSRGAGLRCRYHASPLVTNCTFYGNNTPNYGSGICVGVECAPIIANTIIAFGLQSEAVYCDDVTAAPVLVCCDLYGNEGGDWVDCVAGQVGLNGNFSADPLFCDAAGGDFTLHANSPCAEASNPGCGQLGAWPTGCGPTTYTVLPDGSGDFQWIQDALDEAPPGSVVNLVEGTYTGAGNRNLDFGGKALTLRGLPANPEDCVIDCEDAARGFHFHSGEDEASVVEGLLVKNGAADLGAGALCDLGSSPTFSAVIFDDCHATEDGGGLLCEDHSSPVVDTCIFMNCTAADDGGGLYAHDFSSPALTEGLFRWNEAGDGGGGANFTVNSFPTVAGCVFQQNQAANGGGASFVYSYGPLTDCLFWDNTATATGGGLHCYGNAQCTVTRCTFVENAAPAGGGAYCRNNSSPGFANTIIAASTQGEALARYADDCNPTLACCDLFGNAGGDWVGFIAPQYGVDGNIAEDPLFCLAGYLDFTLSADSPCAAENNPGCGQIGAFGVGCAAPPDIAITPAELHFTTGPGGTDAQDLTIANTGGQDLHWSIAETAARLRLPGGGILPVTLEPAGDAGRDVAAAVATGAAEPRGAANGLVVADARRDDPDAGKGTPVLRGSGGPDGAGYTWVDSDEPDGPAFAWEDITGIGTEIVLGMDDSHALTLDFTFPFYGVGHTGIEIGSHGYMTFSGYGTDYTNDPIPAAQQPNDYIAPFWDDVSTYYGGSVHFWRDPGADRLIVQWTDVQHYGGSLPYTFQVHLQGDGSILFQYLDLQGSVASATVGIENPGGTDGLQVVYNAYYLHDGLAVLLRPGLDWLSATPSSGTLPPSGSEIVTVTVDATGLAPGSYQAELIVTSDDPDEPTITVPVTLDVVSSIVVDPAGGGDYTSIGAALDAAMEGMIIELVPGTYTGPGNRDLDYGGKGVTIRPQGGRAGECVIDCEGLGRAFTFHSGEDSTSVLEGVTIVNGLEWDGGAVACVSGSSPLLRDCVFLDNSSTDDGGAVYCSDGSSPVLDHCVLSGNSCADDGGAMACQNSSSPQIRYGVFRANHAGDLAGAVHLLNASAPAICASTFAANTSGSAAAGAFYCWNGSAAALTGCIIAFSDAGAAVFCAGDGPYPTLVCCDVYGNAGGDWTGCIADQADLNGNLCADPRFCDLDAGNLTLAANSPCLPENNDCGVLMGALGEGCPATPVPEGGVPAAAFLAQNAPNPFNPVTEIRFGLPAPAAVSLTVFDVAGRRVRRLLAGEYLPAGVHRVVWQGRTDDGRPVASGIYLYRVEAGGYVATRKMTLLK